MEKLGYLKSEFTVFAFSKTENNYWFYTQEFLDEWDDRHRIEDINLTGYLGVDDIVDVVAMVHPELPIITLKDALLAWEQLPTVLPDSHYYYSTSRKEWR